MPLVAFCYSMIASFSSVLFCFKRSRREDCEAILKHKKRRRRTKTHSFSKTVGAIITRFHILAGEATACRMEGRIYEATGGRSQGVGRQIGRKRPPKARFQLGRPQIQPRRPDSSPEGRRKQESSPKPPKTARMRHKPRNRRKGTQLSKTDHRVHR